MMSEGVACEVVRIRMRRNFVGNKVISAVIKCWKEDNSEELSRQQLDRAQREDSKTTYKLDTQLNDALSLLLHSDVAKREQPINLAAASSAAQDAAYVALQASIDATIAISKYEAEFDSKDARRARRERILRELQAARKEERERRSRSVVTGPAPLFRRKQRERRRKITRMKRSALRKRMEEAQREEEEREKEADIAMNRRIDERIEKVRGLVARHRKIQRDVRDKMERKAKRKERKDKKKREIKSFWKALIRGDAE